MIKPNFEAINISTKNFSRERNFLLSDLKFSLNRNETATFFFNKNDEKKSFLSIFSEQDSSYLGLFRVNHEIYSSLTSPISKISQIHKFDIFDKVNPNSRVIEFVEKKVLNYQQHNILDAMKMNHKLEKHLRMLKIYKYKKIEYSYVQSINTMIRNAILMIKQNIEKLNQDIQDKKDINEAYEYFVFLHTKYLKKRINLIIDRNIMLIDLFFKEFKKENLNDENLYLKSIEFARKIEEENVYDRSLEKTKRQIISSFSAPDVLDKETNYKDVLFLFVEELENKLILYSKKIKTFEKKDKNYLRLYKRRIVVKNFIFYLKHEIKQLSFVDSEKIVELYEELNYLYKKLLMESDSELSNLLKSNIKVEISSHIASELENFFDTFKKNNEIKKVDKTKNKFMNNIKHKNKKYESNFDITKMKLDGQDLLDEIEWRKQSLFYNFNENLNNIIALINKELAKYKKNKETYNNLLLEFLRIKNQYIHNSNLTSDQFNRLNDNFFADQFVKYETIYKFLQSDSKSIDKIFSKQSYILKNIKNTESSLISRYMILKISKKFGLSIFDLLRRIGRVDKIFKRIISLLIAHLDGKEISIFENFFSDLTYEEAEVLSVSYNNSIRTSNKEWILIESNIKKAKKVSTNIYIIDNSKNIEYGKTDDIFRNPFYNSTKRAMDLEINETYDNETPNDFSETIDFNYDNDYYLVEGDHIIFGKLEKIYKSLDVIPKLCLRTTSAEILSNFESKINFEKENSTIEDLNVPAFESEEFLIVDINE